MSVVKRINSDKKSVANEGVVTMSNNEVNNFEEQETLMSNETVISEEKDIKEDESQTKLKKKTV